jgi:hypothetical protein
VDNERNVPAKTSGLLLDICARVSSLIHGGLDASDGSAPFDILGLSVSFTAAAPSHKKGQRRTR